MTNAIQFIKDHGVDKAREVVEGAPDRATTVKPSLDFKHFMYGICENAAGAYILLSDLKRVVESVDYVAIHGYEKSKEILKNPPDGAECYSWLLGNSGVRDKTVELVKLKQAIADYESIGGEHV